MARPDSPFHSGEIAAQHRAGVGRQAAEAGHFIRPAMPEQHQAFFAGLPFLVVAGGDETGAPWVTILDGDPQPVISHDATHLRLATRPAGDDPLAATFVDGAPIGVLGIELASRRRNRVNGVLRAEAGALVLDVTQSFGNCPQHIHPRPVTRLAQQDRPRGPTRLSDRLDPRQRYWIETADTFFFGTGFRSGEGLVEG
ncbi:ferredoxin, partial [Thioclava sp. BHET1]